nr:reverse transcriptase [Tanacetum cinerariifolium]
TSQIANLSRCDQDGLLEVEHVAILDRKMIKKRNDIVVYDQVQWANVTAKDATWEPLAELLEKFPNVDAHS